MKFVQPVFCILHWLFLYLGKNEHQLIDAHTQKNWYTQIHLMLLIRVLFGCVAGE